jgi:hypothetical protein
MRRRHCPRRRRYRAVGGRWPAWRCASSALDWGDVGLFAAVVRPCQLSTHVPRTCRRPSIAGTRYALENGVIGLLVVSGGRVSHCVSPSSRGRRSNHAVVPWGRKAKQRRLPIRVNPLRIIGKQRQKGDQRTAHKRWRIAFHGQLCMFAITTKQSGIKRRMK